MNLTAIIAAILALANALDKKDVLSFEEYRDALLSMYREMPHEDASGDAGHIFDGMLSQLERVIRKETNVNGGGSKVISYDLENQAKGAKQTTEVISDDPKYAIFKADQWRGHGWEVWIEDINGNKVDEAALRKAADQTYPHAPPLNYEFD